MSSQTVAITTSFIDLSTYDEIEVFFYGGRSVNKFRKVIRRSNWFTVIAAQLNKGGTTGDFEGELQAIFSRAGDYIRDVWLRCVLPEIRTRQGYQARWTKNIGHNLIEEAFLQFNDLIINKLTSASIDFWTAFTVSASKRNGYDNMIGNIDPLTDPYRVPGAVITVNQSAVLPAHPLNVPLPFYFTHETTDSIPQAAAPFNDIRVSIKFRGLQNLLIIDELATDSPGNTFVRNTCATTDLSLIENCGTIRLGKVEIWAHYAVIPNGDREKLAEELEIDTIVEQVQHIPATPFNPSNSSSLTVDLRLTHSVRALFFAVRNATCRPEHSNYTSHHTVPDNAGGLPSVNFAPAGSTDPIARAVLKYENIDRVNMASDYFSLVNPYYTATAIPMETGYHLFNYANNLCSTQPDGSTNYARLSSASLTLEASEAAIAQSQNGDRFEALITASSITVLRFSAGAAGFPVL